MRRWSRSRASTRRRWPRQRPMANYGGCGIRPSRRRTRWPTTSRRRSTCARGWTRCRSSCATTRSGDIVGCTRYFNVDAANRRLEIGHTWYAKRVQRTALNTECKLLLLGHAFEKLRCIAVEFRTHWFNHASRAAIARLGAKQDGVLRNHQADAGRREARHRRVQHHRRRVAGGEAAPAIPAGAADAGDAHRLLPPPQGAQAAGVHARAADAAGGAGQARRLAVDRRLLHAVARLLRQGRAALRPLRPGVRDVLQERQRDLRHPRRDSRGVAEEGIPALPVGRGQEAGRSAGRLGQADGDAEEAARGAARPAPGRLEVDRHRRHQSRSAPTATTRRAFASGRTAAARAARSRSGTSGRSAIWTATSSSTRATSRWRCAGCGASRARACRRNSTWTARSTAPRAMPAGST